MQLVLACGIVFSQTADTAAKASAPQAPGANDSAALATDSSVALAASRDRDALAQDSLERDTSQEQIFELYDIFEKGLTGTLWRLSGNYDDMEDGRYRVLFLSDSLPRAYLLRGGTQVGRLPDSSLPYLRDKIRTGGLKRGGESGLWKNFWNPSDPLQPFLWPTGLNVELATAVLVTPNTSPHYERHMNMTFAQRPAPWLVTELGGHLSTYGGGLRRNLYNPLDQPLNISFWDVSSPWWHVAVGVPGIKWEVALANRPFPELYWLEPNAGQASYMAGRNHVGIPVSPAEADSMRRGKLMREWSKNGEPIPSGRNLSHTVHVKAGSLQYSVYIDPDVYRSVVHRLYFEGLEAPMGSWGFGFFLADGIGQTFVRFDVAPWRVDVGKPVDGNYFRFSFLRLEIAYRDNQRYRLGLATNVRLDSRTFSYGDKP